MTSGCFNEDDIRRLLAGNVTGDALPPMESHLESCAKCRLQLEQASHAGYSTELPLWSTGETRSDHLREVISRLKCSPSGTGNTQEAPDDWETEIRLLLDPPTQPGDLGQLGHYRITGVIGRGGMGIVFRGLDSDLERLVAIKVMNPALAASTVARERFTREARAAAVVQHENLVTIHAVDSRRAVPFIVMEHVDGQSLQQRLESGPMAFDEIARLAGEVATGLAAAHAKGLVHRDVKPANILLPANSGRPKITDFGLARVTEDSSLTQSGIVAGTPEYMSPEQARGEDVDARSDLFSLGLVLIAMVTGSSPMRGRTVLDTIRRICDESPPPLNQHDRDVPGWFCDLVARLVEKDPGKRPQSASEVASCIRQQTVGQLIKPDRRWTGPVVAVFAVGILAAIMVWGFSTSWGNRNSSTIPAAPHIMAGDFRIVGREATWTTLADAIAAAQDQDIIELSVDGELIGEPVNLKGRALTLRAAPGFLPVIVSASGNLLPFLTSDSAITLEGLVIYWSIADGLEQYSRESKQSQCAIRADGADLCISHCRIITSGRCATISVKGAKASVHATCLVAPESPAIYWIAHDPTALSLTGSVVTGKIGLVIDRETSSSGTGKYFLRVDRCTLIGELYLMLIVGSESNTPIDVESTDSVFDYDTLCQLASSRTQSRSAFPPSDGQAERRLKATIDWRESGNLYDTPKKFLVCSILSRRDVSVEAGPKTWAAWNKFWNQDETAATSVDLVFRKGEIRSGEIPTWQLPEGYDRVEKTDRGAPAGRVGPEGERELPQN